MRFAFYCGVVLVALAGVVFGLDWTPAPMQPMPGVKNVVFVPPPPPPAPRVVTPAAAPAAPAPVSTPVAQPTPPPAPPATAAAAPKIQCDVEACAAAYRSFRESDCTYNPSSGPRRLCTKGNPEKYARETPAPAAPAVAPAVEQPSSIMTPEPGPQEPGKQEPGKQEPGAATDATAPPRCNVAACAAAYPRSFRESDCTFNPSSGARKLCEK